ncbi:MAG: DNA-processing protein DprA [Pirellulales bacterium]|nr:DNA-processing protein DprA [Pirellulales bacterium]
MLRRELFFAIARSEGAVEPYDNNSVKVAGCDDQELELTLRLALVPGVGPRIRQALLERFGSPEAVFSASQAALRETSGVGVKLAQAISAARNNLDIAGLIAECRDDNVGIITQCDDAYPRLLQEIHDPPGVLFVDGQLQSADALAIAIVGTRHATNYGLAQAQGLAAGLARAGLTIVSGLARGVDAAAHRGALKAGGRTIAVLASGVRNIYPPEHEELAAEIASQGAVVSEAPPRVAPRSGVFPQRNRVISGMSLGVLVIEAAARSGALITARHAMEQGRDVFALPGRVDNRVARGCHALLRDGAKLVESPDDILEELGPLVSPATAADGETVHHPGELLLNDLEREVLAKVQADATSIDDIVTASGLPAHQVLSALSVLEMRRLIRRLSGQFVCRV